MRNNKEKAVASCSSWRSALRAPRSALTLSLLLAGCAPQTWCVPVTNLSHPEMTRKSCWEVPNLLGVDNCATIPPGAMPPPNGSHVREWNGRMAAAAAADRFVIYLYEWCPCSQELSPGGRRHLSALTLHLPEVPFPVVVQPSGDGVLDQVRRQMVVHCLLEHGIADADARVLLLPPAAEGLYGTEARRIYQEFQAEQRGSQVGGFGTATGGAGFTNGFGGVGGFGGLGNFGGFGY